MEQKEDGEEKNVKEEVENGEYNNTNNRGRRMETRK